MLSPGVAIPPVRRMRTRIAPSTADGRWQDGLGASREELKERSDAEVGVGSPLVGSGRHQGGAAWARDAGTLAVVEGEVPAREIGDGEAVHAHDMCRAGNVWELSSRRRCVDGRVEEPRRERLDAGIRGKLDRGERRRAVGRAEQMILVTTLFRRGQADRDSEAIVALRLAQDVRRVLDAAVKESSNDVGNQRRDGHRVREPRAVLGWLGWLLGSRRVAGRWGGQRERRQGRRGYRPSATRVGEHTATA